jgi:hypothetical protein
MTALIFGGRGNTRGLNRVVDRQGSIDDIVRFVGTLVFYRLKVLCL